MTLASLDWPRITSDLDARGVATLGILLSPQTCEALQALYEAPAPGPHFRSRIVMSRHGFGSGEYKYFAYPLPPVIARLRESLYARLVPIANRWHDAMGLAGEFPPSHPAFIAQCRAAGQVRPTPLLLRYRDGDHNCLHQDVYGEQVFPLQVIVLLSRPGVDFDGGELVLTEQRPRMQSVPIVVPLRQGEAAVIAVSRRPKQGARGVGRVNTRHGVAHVRPVGPAPGAVVVGEAASASRFTAGIIFHDAA